ALTGPERYDRVIPEPCKVTILIVTDGHGSFKETPFSFKELVDALRASQMPGVRFDIRLAHRTRDPVRQPLPGYDSTCGFVFTDQLINNVDEVWLFGLLRDDKGHPGALDERELECLSRFMDSGGGVFATGDHEDLGFALCASIPRVRSMRKWYWPTGPDDEPVAPVSTGSTRHDTLHEGHDRDYQT